MFTLKSFRYFDLSNEMVGGKNGNRNPLLVLNGNVQLVFSGYKSFRLKVRRNMTGH